MVEAETYEEMQTSWLSLPGVVLLDIRLPGSKEITTLLSIRRSSSQTRILLFIIFAHEGYYLLNVVIESTVPLPIHDTCFDLLLLIRASSAPATCDPSKPVPLWPNPHGLTERELEIVQLVARGLVVKEVARALVVSEKTIRNHLSSIYRRLNVYDRSQIVIYALQHGLVTLPQP